MGDTGTNPRRILIVEDDRDLRDLLVQALTRAKYRTHEVTTGELALSAIANDPPDLVLLDLGLPDSNGIDILKTIRSKSDVPVIIITGRGAEADRVVGLELGADDYVVKPLMPRELTARVRSVLRRVDPTGVADRLQMGDLTIDVSARIVTVRGNEVDLTPKEFELLAYLAASPRRAFSRSQILQNVWGSAWQSETTVTEHIRRLRHKIESDPADPRYLVTVRGVGYRFEP